MPKTTRDHSAFTLVELLVTLSILAILITLLVPALKKPREATRALQCKSRIRSLGQASFTYISDYGKYPPSLMNSPLPWFGNGWSKFDWLGAGHGGEGADAAPQTGLFWKYVRSEESYRCLSDREASVGAERRFSFSMNGRTGLMDPGAFRGTKDSAQATRLRDAELPLFVEESPTANLLTHPEGCFNGSDRPEFRHSQKANVGFADGHVDGMSRDFDGTANDIYRRLRFDPPLVVLSKP